MVTSAAVTVRTRKVKANSLLQRKQMIVDVVHPGMPNLSKFSVREKLATMYKCSVDNVVCFGFRTQFGGGRSVGFALVYESIDALKKFEPKYRLIRNGVMDKVTRPGRKLRKEKKNRAKKIRGTMKHQGQAAKK